MAIPINEVKSGLTVEIDRELYRCLEYHHQRSAQQTWIRIKLKNLRTGAIIEKTFKPQDKIETARIEYKPMQFLYADGQGFHFMDQQTFEQLMFSSQKIGESAKYLKEGLVVNVSFFGEEALDIELPASVELKVSETAPGFKGDTVSGGKPATLETGAVITVPFHISVGDVVKVNTSEGKYLGKA